MKPDYLNTPRANEGADDVIGAGMEHRGEITLLPGEDYAQKALARLTVQYLSSGDNKQ
ncbi:hypothetical protein Q3R78_004435 [Salmonella enterica]|nr:hypothetical protein [Salmonella enterica]ELM1349691.1 hypothetical protein [Salmonella enterica]